MASISTLVDRVKIQVLSSGTGAFSLGTAVPAYRGVEALIDGAIYSYAVESGSNYEFGTGVYNAESSQFVRSPQGSSAGGAAVAFPANVQLVFTALAADLTAIGGAFPIVDSTGTATDVAISQRAATAAVNAVAADVDTANEAISGILDGQETWDVDVIPNMTAVGFSLPAKGLPYLDGDIFRVSRGVMPGFRTVFLDDFILPTDPTVSGFPDASLAFARAAAKSSVILGTAGAIYYVKDVVLNGVQFFGQNCVLRDAPGCTFGIKITGYLPALCDFTFQDQGNYVSSTTLAASMATSATVANVTSAAGIAVDDIIFIQLDVNEIRHQTIVTAVSGNNVTIRDAVPSAASSGQTVDAMTSAIRVGTSNRWLIENVLVVNARGALLLMPDGDTAVSNRGTLRTFQTDSCRYYGVIKAKNQAGVKAYDLKLWGGYTDTFNYTGTGGAGPFSFNKKVFLTRDITVTVNGVAAVYGTDYNFASQTAIQFLSGHFPAVGAAIVINHFRDGFRGFVDDQRNTSIISGGNLYDTIEALDFFVGASAFEAELTEWRSLIADTCSYVALQLTACVNTVVFSGDCFCGYSGSSLKLFNSNPKSFVSLYTKRAPISDTYLQTQDDNIYTDATSVLGINTPEWTGEYQYNLVSGGKVSFGGADKYSGRNIANAAAASTFYLTEAGALAAINFGSYRTVRDSTFVLFQVNIDTAPGAGNTFTYDLLVNGTSAGQIVLTGAGVFSGTLVLNKFVAAGSQINHRLVTSASAPAGVAHSMQAIAA